MEAKPSSQDSESNPSQPALPQDDSSSRSASAEMQKNERDDQAHQVTSISAGVPPLPVVYDGDGEDEDEAEPPGGADVHESKIYRYSPLPSTGKTIRLLCVKPAKSINDPIICDMLQVQLADDDQQLGHRPEYAALSYTWGDPIFDRHIICDGRNIPVTQHLDAALRRFRATTWWMIWVDAVCIDQSSTPERNQQISIMGHIYTQAKMVFVYLGEAGQWDAVGIKHMISLIKMARIVHGESFEHLSDVDRNRVIRLREPRNAGLPGGPNEFLGRLTEDMKSTAAQAVVARPWFTRVWVIQEVALSSSATVLLGPYQFPFDVFFAYLAAILKLGLSKPKPSMTKEANMDSAFAFITITRLADLKMKRKRFGLVELLGRFRKSRASDPRDKIYSLLGLANDIDQTLTPDYSKSDNDVYLDYAYHLVQTGNAMEMLLHAGIAQDREKTEVASTLPSWVPDWSQQGSDCFAVDSELCQAHGVSQPTVRIEDDRLGLKVKGIVLDSLERFHCGLLDLSDLAAWEQSLREVAHPSQLHSEYGPGSYATVLMTALPWRFPVKDDPQAMGRYDRIFKLPPSHGSYNQEYRSHLITLTKEYKFCVSQDGHIGWVPLCSRAGDIICVFYGGYCPFVIRKIEESYMLVGVAWIEGYMRGEAFDMDGLEVHDFVLR
ncbi:MAG: hypothetical protein Q9161_007614 [Pseudevernia consocians]